MVRVSVIVLVLALASPARAMTWDFASGTQGWHARDGQCAVGGACTPLRSVAEDGVWRVTPLYTADVTAMVDLVSPTLQRAIAFARVPVGAGPRCTVDVRGKDLPARVVRPPFARNGRACEGIL